VKAVAAFCLLTTMAVSMTQGAPPAGTSPSSVPWTSAPIVIELLSDPLALTGADPLETRSFSSFGRSLVGLRLGVSDFTGETCFVNGWLEWRWKETDSFFRQSLKDSRLPPFQPGTSFSIPTAEVYFFSGTAPQELPLLTFPQGPEGRVVIQKYGDCTATLRSVQILLE